jgi:hypothetical protein
MEINSGTNLLNLVNLSLAYVYCILRKKSSQRIEGRLYHPFSYKTRFLTPSSLQNRLKHPVKQFCWSFYHAGALRWTEMLTWID